MPAPASNTRAARTVLEREHVRELDGLLGELDGGGAVIRVPPRMLEATGWGVGTFLRVEYQRIDRRHGEEPALLVTRAKR